MIYCAKKIVNDHHIAEDITQQAFMKVIPRLKTISLEEPEKTKNLLITITERTAIDYYRKEMRKANSISLKDIDSLKYARIVAEKSSRKSNLSIAGYL